ncbi:glycoside hydrolase superfamily [Tribonema minus]|uniref:Glycoside hydrolase superfamily n=1 Tax=Tribonema minus TaxID=303371 RepID=A0A835YRP3_9STRA|nr:glycoside hydrolase superfamily [Tribonema minus]
MLNGEPFQLKGINWSGFETATNVLDGMWPGANNMNNILGEMRVLGFNALRIPLSLDLALAPKTVIEDTACDLCGGQLSWKVLDDLFDLAAAYGILILLDMHRLDKVTQSNLWYDETHTEADFIKGWVAILTKFGGKANLLGIDVKNEPQGECTWGTGNKLTDWNLAAERIVKGIVAKVPTYSKLIFVEGTASDFQAQQPPANSVAPADMAYYKFAGQNLDGVKTNPIDFGDPALNKLLVYSPHVYGPDVFAQPYFAAANFPKNMAAIWDLQMGFLKQATGSAVVTGEWGGNFLGDDLMWATAWTSYLVDKCFNDNFFWVINPNSGDTGGLFAEDWMTVVPLKAALMKKVQPNPSAFTTAITPRGACLNYGKPVCPFVPAATAAAGL